MKQLRRAMWKFETVFSQGWDIGSPNVKRAISQLRRVKAKLMRRHEVEEIRKAIGMVYTEIAEKQLKEDNYEFGHRIKTSSFISEEITDRRKQRKTYGDSKKTRRTNRDYCRKANC